MLHTHVVEWGWQGDYRPCLTWKSQKVTDLCVSLNFLFVSTTRMLLGFFVCFCFCQSGLWPINVWHSACVCICVRVSVVFHSVASLLALWQIVRVKRPLPPPCNETSATLPFVPMIKTPQGHQLQLQRFLLWLRLTLEKLWRFFFVQLKKCISKRWLFWDVIGKQTMVDCCWI